MSVYTLDSEDRKSVDDIFTNLDQLRVVEELKKKLAEFTDTAMDQITDYMLDEYVLRFEDIVTNKARKLVSALLRGEDLSAFGLQSTTRWNTNEEVSYDSDKVRAAIVEKFADKIMNAEMLELKSENKRLSEENKYLRQQRERY